MKRTIRAPENATATIRILYPYPGIFAYYDGRTGERFASEDPNWLDDGAFTLGVATYSIVSGSEALLFDAAITEAHAQFMLDHVKSLGVIKVTTVYSHFHNDHIAGAPALQPSNPTVPDAILIGHTQTKTTLEENTERLAVEFPPITVVLPTQTYENNMTLQIGTCVVEVHNFNTHTPDGTILFLPQDGILFAGDTLEDTATFISDASKLDVHQEELKRMGNLPITKILPAHGSLEQIGVGGYDIFFIDATIRYIKAVNEDVEEPAAWNKTLKEVVKDDVAMGFLIYFKQYDVVHRENVESIRKGRAIS
jgi:cyclase